MVASSPSLIIRALLTVAAVATLVACSHNDPAPVPVKSVPVASSTSSVAEQPVAVSSDGSAALSRFAGSLLPGTEDGEALSAQFIKPYGLCAGLSGEVLLVDSYGNQIRKIQDGTVSTLVGFRPPDAVASATFSGYRGGAPDQALLNRPRFLAAGKDDIIVFSDSENHMVRISDGKTVRTLAGSLTGGYRDGKADEALFSLPSGVAIGADGSVFVADTLNHCIRVISPEGIVRTLAGTPTKQGFADGPLSQAAFNEPNDLALGQDGALYVVDKGNQRIRRIFEGQVTTVAGSGSDTDPLTGYLIGGYRDGNVKQAQFLYPTGLDVGDDGTIYVADTGNHCIREIKDGQVSTIVGRPPSAIRKNASDDTLLNQPIDILCMQNTLYITDSYNHAVKTVSLEAIAAANQLKKGDT